MEVIVALLVLVVGVLGVAGLLALTGRTLAGAVRLERAVATAEQVADSLADSAVPVVDGRRTWPGGSVEWQVVGPIDPDGAVQHLRILVADSAGTPIVTAPTVLP